MNPNWPAAAQAAENELFGDVLACDALLPAAFLGGSQARTAQAETLLVGLAQVEDLRADDTGEEKRGELPLLAQRLDAKLDLVLMLLGRLVRQSSPALPLTTPRWSGRGLPLQRPASAGYQRHRAPAAGRLAAR